MGCTVPHLVLQFHRTSFRLGLSIYAWGVVYRLPGGKIHVLGKRIHNGLWPEGA